MLLLFRAQQWHARDHWEKTPGVQILYGRREVSFELQATSDVQIFSETPSRLRVPYQSDRGRSPSASCLMHDRPFRGTPQPSDEPWRRFHDAQLPCYARLVPCRWPLESIFRLSKPPANYEPFIEPPE